MPTQKAASISEYIAGFPEETQKVLQQIRGLVKEIAPAAEEAISYAIPAFMLNKTYLVYFAGYKNHVSIYPATTGSEAFEKQVAKYKTGKGTYQFSLDTPLPVSLINKIIRQRLKENLDKQKTAPAKAR